MSPLIDVSVRYTSGAYYARADGKTASCTYDPLVAVKNVGRKLFGDRQKLIITQAKPVTIHEKGSFYISPDPSQSCRVCGCTWYSACEGGCHWISADLCSGCGGDE